MFYMFLMSRKCWKSAFFCFLPSWRYWKLNHISSAIYENEFTSQKSVLLRLHMSQNFRNRVPQKNKAAHYSPWSHPPAARISRVIENVEDFNFQYFQDHRERWRLQFPIFPGWWKIEKIDFQYFQDMRKCKKQISKHFQDRTD